MGEAAVSRRDRELQRRLGTAQIWHMVCFTGKFDVSFLQAGDAGDDSTQIVAHSKDLTRQAQQARDNLRWAESLQRRQLRGKKRLTPQEHALVQDLAEGKLHAAANEATRASGWGRIKHLDGTYEDIAPHNGGIVRTVLDNVVIETDDESPGEEEDKPAWT